HGVCHLDTSWKSVEDEASGFLFEYADEFPVCGKVVFVAEDRCGEMAGERPSRAEIFAGGIAVDQQRIGPKNFIGEFGLADQLIETYREELCLCVERHRGLLSRRKQVCLSSERNLVGADLGCSFVFLGDTARKQRERLGLLNQGLELIEEPITLLSLR